MGLAGPSKRRKIGRDPNNTNWTRDSSTYGHKILSSQGWAPGDTLGAENASHASHFTVASSSHIRVLLKDDNLGLGAKVGRQEDNFGLGQLASIYGRLNGKSEVQLKKEEDVRQDLGTQFYMQQKYGTMPFVRGGYLVGDRIEDRYQPNSNNPRPVKSEPDVKMEPQIKLEPTEESNPKIKSEDDAEADARVKIEEDSDTRIASVAEAKRLRRERKRLKRLKEEAEIAATSTAQRPGSHTATIKVEREQETRPDKIARRKERQDRRARKEARRLAKASTYSTGGHVTSDTATEAPNSGTSTPSTAAEMPLPDQSATPMQHQPFNNRNAVRQRFIRQKRMASMDPRALREILMQTA